MKIKTLKKNPILLIAAGVLALILIAGGVLGTAALIRQKRAAVRFGSYTMSAGEYAYFAVYYKASYLAALRSSGIGAYDTEVFWSLPAEGGKSYGELLREGTDDFAFRILIGAALYESRTSLTSADRKRIDEGAREKLTYLADGDADRFDRECAAYGFSYRDMKSAGKLWYEYRNARTALYGASGQNLGATEADLDEYLSENYAHVKLLFIRTETTFAKDGDGNRVRDGEEDRVVPLTEAEITRRAGIIDSIRALIAAGPTAPEQMSPAVLDAYNAAFDEGDGDYYASGYYFAPSERFSSDFSSAFPDLMQTVYAMEKGTYAEADVGFGVCFIYRGETEDGAYADTLLSDMFENFLSGYETSLYAKTVRALLPDAAYVGGTRPDLTALPASADYIIRF